MNDVIERVPNVQPIRFREETKPLEDKPVQNVRQFQKKAEIQILLDAANLRIKQLEEQLNEKYAKGLEDGRRLGKGMEGHPAMEANQEAWYKRAMAAEYEAKKLKSLLGDVMKTITEGAL